MGRTQPMIEEIREILLREWDTLCIGENPHLKDEYDRYLPRILDIMYSANANVAAIENVLLLIEEKELGVTGSERSRQMVGTKLVKLAASYRSSSN